LDPTIIFSPINEVVIEDDDITVVTLNVSSGSTSSFSMAFSSVDQALQMRYGSRNRKGVSVSTTNFDCCSSADIETGICCDNYCIKNKAIADSGATQIFVMDGTPVHNK
jgi:hypothetical protein